MQGNGLSERFRVVSGHGKYGIGAPTMTQSDIFDIAWQVARQTQTNSPSVSELPISSSLVGKVRSSSLLQRSEGFEGCDVRET